MRTRYDPETDAFYVGFAEATIVESEEVHPGVTLDFDATGRIVAIEVLDVSERVSGGDGVGRPGVGFREASVDPASVPRKQIDAHRLRASTVPGPERGDLAFMRSVRDGDRY